VFALNTDINSNVNSRFKFLYEITYGHLTIKREGKKNSEGMELDQKQGIRFLQRDKLQLYIIFRSTSQTRDPGKKTKGQSLDQHLLTVNKFF
jgi:hypothetical protein